MKPTIKEIEEACENVKIAMVNALKIDQKDTDNKLEKIKARNELLLAKGDLSSIKFN